MSGLEDAMHEVTDQDELRCAICDAVVPPSEDLLDRVKALEVGILCEECEVADYVFGSPQPPYEPVSMWKELFFFLEGR